MLWRQCFENTNFKFDKSYICEFEPGFCHIFVKNSKGLKLFIFFSLIEQIQKILLMQNDELTKKVSNLQNSLSKQTNENEVLRHRVINAESQARRCNLRFLNIREEKGENCEKKILEILHYANFRIPAIGIARAHRLGPYNELNLRYPRPIIVKFEFYKDKEAVLNNRRFFQGITSIVNDLPIELENARKDFNAIANHAKYISNENGSKKYKTEVQHDKIVINHKRYNHDELSQLPDDLQLEKVFTREKGNMVGFFTKHSVFSNHHRCDLELDGIAYTSSEQCYFHQKAQLFEDELRAKQIMQTDDPVKQMRLGRKVRNASDDVWDQHKVGIMKRAITQKFVQNTRLKSILLATDNKTIVECSPSDSFWGIKMPLHDNRIFNELNWRGENTLGKLLAELRDELK